MYAYEFILFCQIGTRVDTSQVPQQQLKSQQQKDEIVDKPPKIEPVFASLIIRIEYTLENPRNGIVFVQQNDEIAPYVSTNFGNLV